MKETTMQRKEMIEKVISLIQLDIDAIHAYEQAMRHISQPIIRDQIAEFRNDHHRHFRELSALVQGMGGEAPEYSPDFRGFLIQGFTALRSATGTEGAINAMETNEKLTNKTYEEATSWDLSIEAKVIVERNLSDERRHLSYIQRSLRDRIWEARTMPPEPRSEARL